MSVALKINSVVLVFINGGLTSPDQYRQISLTSCTFKIYVSSAVVSFPPHICERFDEEQNVFCWDADPSSCNSNHVLQLDQHRLTRSARLWTSVMSFDSHWIKVIFVRMFQVFVTNKMWHVIANVLYDPFSRVRIDDEVIHSLLRTDIRFGRHALLCQSIGEIAFSGHTSRSVWCPIEIAFRLPLLHSIDRWRSEYSDGLSRRFTDSPRRRQSLESTMTIFFDIAQRNLLSWFSILLIMISHTKYIYKKIYCQLRLSVVISEMSSQPVFHGATISTTWWSVDIVCSRGVSHGLAQRTCQSPVRASFSVHMCSLASLSSSILKVIVPGVDSNWSGTSTMGSSLARLTTWKVQRLALVWARSPRWAPCLFWPDTDFVRSCCFCSAWRPSSSPSLRLCYLLFQFWRMVALEFLDKFVIIPLNVLNSLESIQTLQRAFCDDATDSHWSVMTSSCGVFSWFPPFYPFRSSCTLFVYRIRTCTLMELHAKWTRSRSRRSSQDSFFQL